MITRITHEIHVFIEWKLYLHYNGSGIHVSQQWICEFLIFHMWNSTVFWSGIHENNPSSLHALKPWNPQFQNCGIPLSTVENIFLRLSAWAQVHGFFNHNHTPLAPLGTRVLVHEKPGI